MPDSVPSKNYRELEPGEIICEGDEYYSETRMRWCITLNEGEIKPTDLRYRRPVLQPLQSEEEVK